MKAHEKSKLNDIKKAAQVIKNGGVVIFPTDTVYGIGCKFDDERAIERIYKIKNRNAGQAFPILVASEKQAEAIANVNNIAKKLVEKHWPGGLTIILPTRHPDPKTLKIGVRMPNSQVVKQLIEEAETPIIGTSANFHGQPSPRSYEELDEELIKLVDYVVKGECLLGKESTVVDTTVDPPKVLRQGAVTLYDFKN